MRYQINGLREESMIWRDTSVDRLTDRLNSKKGKETVVIILST